MLRRRRPPPHDPLGHVDPAAVSPRFARSVADALDARRRFAGLLGTVAEGPVRDRLVTAGERLDAGVLAVWETVRRAGEIERTLAALDPDRVADDYKAAKRTEGADELTAVLAQRFASVQRLLNALDDTAERLALLDARLGAAVASAAEVALGTSGADALGTELDGVVGDLESLRAALHELG